MEGNKLIDKYNALFLKYIKLDLDFTDLVLKSRFAAIVKITLLAKGGIALNTLRERVVGLMIDVIAIGLGLVEILILALAIC